MIAVDVSIACKWLWPEAGQEEADGLLRGQLPAAEQQNKFHELLETLTATTLADAVDRHIRTFLDKLGPLSDGHLEQLGQLDGIAPDTVMCKRTGTICQVIERVDLAVIHFPGNAIQGPPSLGPALHFIAQADQFAVCSLPGLSESAQQTLARRLFKAGLLTIVKPAPFEPH